jgi:hypothetical protein
MLRTMFRTCRPDQAREAEARRLVKRSVARRSLPDVMAGEGKDSVQGR